MAKIEEILERLHELSSEDKIAWSATADPSTFSAVLGNSSAIISRGESNFHFKLLNSLGDDLDELYSGDWGNPLIEYLYELARRRALKVDAELDDVLVELSQL